MIPVWLRVTEHVHIFWEDLYGDNYVVEFQCRTYDLAITEGIGVVYTTPAEDSFSDVRVKLHWRNENTRPIAAYSEVQPRSQSLLLVARANVERISVLNRGRRRGLPFALLVREMARIAMY
jgi:hypothetical protein